MTRASADTGRRPRYLQVRDQLVERIQSGDWSPGQPIPSEMAIAREFGVAPGTARLAISALASEKVVVRRQGLGTFVYEHTPEAEQERFCRLFNVRHGRIGTEGRRCRPVRRNASRTECRQLDLAEGSRVLHIVRVRERNGVPFVREHISLPEALFPGLAERQRLPDSLYEMYQKEHGVLVVEVEERLTAVPASKSAATDLKIAVGTPLLRIERIALALGGKPVEWRISLCHLAGAHYLARLK